MIVLYHVNMATGEIGKCSASARQCPFGSNAVHYIDPVQAREGFEKAMAEQTHTSHSKSYSPEPYSRQPPMKEPEKLEGPIGYYRVLHASSIPGSSVKVIQKKLIGSLRYRFIQQGDSVTTRAWLRICDETKGTKLISPREFMAEFFHARDYKRPESISLKRGVAMELRLPKVQKVNSWLELPNGNVVVKHYSDDHYGRRQREDAVNNWEKAIRLSQKGIREPELKSWLTDAYEELDQRDRPPRETIVNLLRARN